MGTFSFFNEKKKSSHSLGWKMSLNRNIGEEMRNSLTLSLGVRHSSLAYNVHACGWMNYFSYRFLWVSVLCMNGELSIDFTAIGVQLYRILHRVGNYRLLLRHNLVVLLWLLLNMQSCQQEMKGYLMGIIMKLALNLLSWNNQKI